MNDSLLVNEAGTVSEERTAVCQPFLCPSYLEALWPGLGLGARRPGGLCRLAALFCASTQGHPTGAIGPSRRHDPLTKYLGIHFEGEELVEVNLLLSTYKSNPRHQDLGEEPSLNWSDI